jgi:hypothetical protein
MNGPGPSPFEGRASHGHLRANAIAFVPGVTDNADRA